MTRPNRRVAYPEEVFFPEDEATPNVSINLALQKFKSFMPIPAQDYCLKNEIFKDPFCVLEVPAYRCGLLCCHPPGWET